MSTSEAVLTHADEPIFCGHPKGLFYLAFTEARERISYYGMMALLPSTWSISCCCPDMSSTSLDFLGFVLRWNRSPAHSQHRRSRRRFSVSIRFRLLHPRCSGGMIADRWIGQRNGVVIGAPCR
jgi:POT family proton-dependent oligopeptide transporter